MEVARHEQAAPPRALSAALLPALPRVEAARVEIEVKVRKHFIIVLFKD
jgi:hypothetical protein